MIKRFEIKSKKRTRSTARVYSSEFSLPNEIGRITGICAGIEIDLDIPIEYSYDILGFVHISVNNIELLHSLPAYPNEINPMFPDIMPVQTTYTSKMQRIEPYYVESGSLLRVIMEETDISVGYKLVLYIEYEKRDNNA
jgi:hypothetical protein